MRIVMMCPKCGNIRFPDIDKTLGETDKICDCCNTERMDVRETVEDCNINYEDDIELFKQRVYRKYLYNNPQFDEEAFERRINHAKAFREEIRQTVANSPKCPTCGSTNIQAINGLERGASILTLGLFSNKINKSFKCNHCGYAW